MQEHAVHKNNFVTQAFCSVEDHFSNWPFKILLLCAELQDHALKDGLDALYEIPKVFLTSDNVCIGYHTIKDL